jgi:UDP-glucose 4-epimerase
MRVLLTGGADYIGSVLTEELLTAGHEVTVYDDLSHGYRDAVADGARFELGDVLDTKHLIEVLRRSRAEAVIHAAGFIAVGESLRDPRLYYRVNVEGGLRLLDAVLSAEIRYLVFSSTAAVYGPPKGAVLQEADATCPGSPYGETKLAFEQVRAVRQLLLEGESLRMRARCTGENGWNRP